MGPSSSLLFSLTKDTPSKDLIPTMPATILVDLKNQVVGGVSIAQTFTGTTAAHLGTAVDLQLSDGPVFAVLQTGSVTGSGVDIDVKLQEADTSGGTYSDVTNGAFTQSYTETNGDLVFEMVNGRRTKRYVRAHLVIAATTSVTSAPITVSVFGQKKILGGAGYQTSE